MRGERLAMTAITADYPGTTVPLHFKPILTFPQLAEYLGIPQSTLEEIVKRFPLPAFRLGRHRVIRRERVADWLDVVEFECTHVPAKRRRVHPAAFNDLKEAA